MSMPQRYDKPSSMIDSVVLATESRPDRGIKRTPLGHEISQPIRFLGQRQLKRH
jgi:hypothetical protein